VENIGAADHALSSEDVNAITAAVEATAVAGERDPEELEKRTGL
jgi:hypothetical protein